MTTIAARPPVAPPVVSRAASAAALLHGPAQRSAPLAQTPRATRGAGAEAEAEEHREQLRRVRSLAAVVAVACLEAEAGRRPLRDLAGWLDPESYEKMSRRVDLLRRSGTRPVLTTAPRPTGARVCEVAPGRIEASATVVAEGRARAFALRIERRLRRWKVTALEIG